MSFVIQALLKSLPDLSERRVLKVLAKSLGITIIILIIAGGLAALCLYAALTSLGISAEWEAEVRGLVTLVLALIAGWFLFRIIALGVLQFFADEIVAAVESRHYTEKGQALSFRQDMQNSLRSMGRALIFNLLALPVAVVLVFTAIGPGILFILVNAVLLGRELTDMCWLRLCPVTGVADQTPVSGSERFLLGASVAGLMLIPLINLLAPVIGAAAGTHLVHSKRAGQIKGLS